MNMLFKAHFRFLSANLAALFRGRWSYQGGHLPPAGGHKVAEGFAGVGVATATDPAVDDAVIAQLRATGLRRVRLDMSYGDAGAHVGRFFQRLCDEGFAVTLHLVQPVDAARYMPKKDACRAWQGFVADALDRFGERAELVEVCSTINRKRWAGYSLNGFLAAWQIAHDAVRERGLVLAGPSITDFEPPWTVGMLTLLAERNQLPDIHTDNLFAERATEPERWDHKILGRRLAPLARFNLMKKARLLGRLSREAGVPRLMSPAAFWTLPRIERMLPDSEQKQADYLARYLVLCAASGELEAAWWGPLVCHREGLVDDGEHPYPKLERITHYAGVDGTPDQFRARPALHALATFNWLIPGAHYEGRLCRGQGLEVHAFRSDAHRVHVVWTANGRVAAAEDVYSAADLAAAECFDRDGGVLDEAAELISEAPLYLRWPAERPVAVADEAAPMKGLSVHRHDARRHFYVRDEQWHGMVLAQTRAEADALIAALHPESIGAPPAKSEAMRHARNAIWSVPDPREPDRKLVVKKPIKHHLHKKLLDRFKPSKARRSWAGAAELQRRGLDTATPVAWFELRNGRDITANWYVCEHVKGVSAGALFSAYAREQAHSSGIGAEQLYLELAAFIRKMHNRGIFFRDLSGGNILVVQHGDDLQFKLIDTARTHIFERSLPRRKRLADLTRATHKLHPAGREVFLQRYFNRPGKKLSPPVRLRFHLYDKKAEFKRWLRETRFYKRLKR